MRAHRGVAMEGYFWRITEPETGRVVIALYGANTGARGSWSTIGLAAWPAGFLRTAAVDGSWTAPDRLGVRGGSGGFGCVGEPNRVRVDLGADTRQRKTGRRELGVSQRPDLRREELGSRGVSRRLVVGPSPGICGAGCLRRIRGRRSRANMVRGISLSLADQTLVAGERPHDAEAVEHLPVPATPRRLFEWHADLATAVDQLRDEFAGFI